MPSGPAASDLRAERQLGSASTSSSWSTAASGWRSWCTKGRFRAADGHFLPSPAGSEMRSRWDMQLAPPDIMITNYSMLNVALMRDDETQHLRSHAPLARRRTEQRLHARGGRDAPLPRHGRLRGGLPGAAAAPPSGARRRPDQFRVIATTASIDWDRSTDREFVIGLLRQARRRLRRRSRRACQPPGRALPAERSRRSAERRRHRRRPLADPCGRRDSRSARLAWRPVPASAVARALFPGAEARTARSTARRLGGTGSRCPVPAAGPPAVPQPRRLLGLQQQRLPRRRMEALAALFASRTFVCDVRRTGA